jgi:[histone H3]-dimethyl-L-lysine9 demethylase
MCRRCGREACSECFSQVRELTVDRPGASGAEIAALQSRREKHAHSNPFFLSCTKRNEHMAGDFCPVSRFCKEELAQAIQQMETLLAEPDADALPVQGAIDPSLNGGPKVAPPGGHLPSGTSLTPPELIVSNHSSTESSEVHTPPESLQPPAAEVPKEPASVDAVPVVEATGEVPCHETRRFTDSELTDEAFRAVWSLGEPLVVTGLLGKFKLQWNPEYFMDKYGSQTCLVIECQTDVNKRVTVGQFFSWFGKYEERTECWKLKVCGQRGTIQLADPRRRIGHRLRNSRRRFPNCTKISYRRYLCPIMFDVMAR